jgi:hypothetical protein
MTGFPLLAGIPIEVREQESAFFAGARERLNNWRRAANVYP